MKSRIVSKLFTQSLYDYFFTGLIQVNASQGSPAGKLLTALSFTQKKTSKTSLLLELQTRRLFVYVTITLYFEVTSQRSISHYSSTGVGCRD